jgi:hypothetical protein
MTRAISATEKLYLRKDGQASALKLAFPAPNILFEAQVDQTFSSFDSVVSIDYIVLVPPVGDYGNVYPQMTVWIGTQPGLFDIGIARVRAIDDTTVYIGETSELDLTLGTALFLTFVDEVLPWARHIRNKTDTTCWMDYDVDYLHQYENMNPVANLGPDAVIYEPDSIIDGGNPAVITFDAYPASFMPDGTAIDTYGWFIAGGDPATIFIDDASVPNIVVTVIATGTWRLGCTIVGKNKAETTGFRTLVVYDHDPTHSPVTQFNLTQPPSASVDDGGWSFEVTLYGEAAIAQVHDRQQVILFARDWYGDLSSVTSDGISFDASTKQIESASGLGLDVFLNGATIRVSGSAANDGIYTVKVGGVPSTIVVNEDLADEAAGATVTIEVLRGQTEVSLGPVDDRKNIICVGWIDKDTLHYNPDGSSVTFSVQGPHYWLNKITGFILGIEDSDTVSADWTEFYHLTVDKGLFSLLYWRSTHPFFADMFLTDDTRPCPSVEAQEGSLWDQIKVNSWNTILARPACNCFGQLYIEIDPQLVPVAVGDDRPFPVVIDIQGGDCEKGSLEILRDPHPRMSVLAASGVEYAWGNAGVGTARMAYAPGHVFKHFGLPDTLEKIIIASQSQLNDLAGLYLAKANNNYPEIKLRLTQNNRFVDICPRQYVHLTRQSADNPRGILFDANIVPTRVSRTFDARLGFMGCEITGEAETRADLAVTGTIPVVTPPGEPPIIPIPFPPFTPLPWAIQQVAQYLLLEKTSLATGGYIKWDIQNGEAGSAFGWYVGTEDIIHVKETGLYAISMILNTVAGATVLSHIFAFTSIIAIADNFPLGHLSGVTLSRSLYLPGGARIPAVNTLSADLILPIQAGSTIQIYMNMTTLEGTETTAATLGQSYFHIVKVSNLQ